MKVNFICFKLSKTVVMLITIIFVQIILIIWGIKEIRETNSFEQIQNDVNRITNKIELQNQKDADENVEYNKTLQEEEQKTNESIKLEEYKNMPREQKGYQVIGKIEIPKLNLSSYILSETNQKTLKVYVTKLYGPEINKVGNFCIAGHNYRNNKMFGGIKNLEIGDEITLTDTYDRSIKYQVYDSYKTNPKDVSCLNQETNGEREITLITCTTGAIKRVIVKAVEVYD